MIVASENNPLISTLSRKRILLINDDKQWLDQFQVHLVQKGFDVDYVHNGELGIKKALSGKYDIIILELVLPTISGIQVLSMIRITSMIPVIMVSENNYETDRITGLEIGADDYVSKSCSPREISARIDVILRRVNGTDSSSSVAISSSFSVGKLLIWSSQQRAEYDGAYINLTTAEFNLLKLLAQNAGHLVTKDKLSRQVLGRQLERFDRSIDVHISNIRRKLEPLPNGRSRILTIVGKGYQLFVD